MKKRVAVSTIMTTDLKTVHPGQTFSEVKSALEESGVHHIPVVNGSKLVGLISSSDMLRLSFGSAFGQDTRGEMAVLDSTLDLDAVMVKNLKTISPKDTIHEAAEILAEGSFHSLPVVDGENLVGMITTTDLLRYFLAQY